MATRKKNFKPELKYLAIIIVIFVGIVMLWSDTGSTGKFSVGTNQDNDKDGHYMFNSDPNKRDCDDNNANIYPRAKEVCDGKDNNCDGRIDNGVPTKQFYKDSDGDGYGDSHASVTSCSAPQGYVRQSGDCNDNNAAINPGAAEICGDNIDNNCNGPADGTLQNYYKDSDGDGRGSARSGAIVACSAPAGYASRGDVSNAYVSSNDDCNDNNAAINSGAKEICDGTDNNCDGQIDEDVKTTYYRDSDGDGYGWEFLPTIIACAAPSNYVINKDDCNDNNAAINPSATEVCDGVDNNCDLQHDEGSACAHCSDSDGGDNVYVKGTCIDTTYTHIDYCDPGVQVFNVQTGRWEWVQPAIPRVREFYCDESTNTCQVKWKEVSRCTDGYFPCSTAIVPPGQGSQSTGIITCN